MVRLRTLTGLVLFVTCLPLCGCRNEKTTTRKVTIEGPNKKTEVKVETTEVDRDDR